MQDVDPLDVLAEEFLERCRRGKSPTVEEYAARHRKLAHEIRELFPTIAALENFKLKRPAPPDRAQPPHDLGDLQLVREIGRGGMGVVYEAQQHSLDRRVAVKILPQHLLAGETNYKRFKREARTAARLQHANIVPVFGVGEQDGVHYFVMQYIRGVGLDRIVAALKQRLHNASTDVVRDARTALADRAVESLLHRGGDSPDTAIRDSALPAGSTATQRTLTEPVLPPVSPLDPLEPTTVDVQAGDTDPAYDFSAEDRAVEAMFAHTQALPGRRGAAYWRNVARIGEQVAEALAYAHSEGVLHRDIKPGNLLLDDQNRAWVSDFGLAKAIEQENVTATGGLAGTLRYMAPEQFYGESDARSDIYSLGLTLYELITLEPAFQGTNQHHLVRRIAQGDFKRPHECAADVPRDLETIMLTATKLNPGDRYATAGDMAADLRLFLTNEPVEARALIFWERGWRWAKRHRGSAAAGAIVCVLLLAAVLASAAGLRLNREAGTVTPAAGHGIYWNGPDGEYGSDDRVLRLRPGHFGPPRDGRRSPPPGHHPPPPERGHRPFHHPPPKGYPPR